MMSRGADAGELNDLFDLLSDNDEVTRGAVARRVFEVGWVAVDHFYGRLALAGKSHAASEIRRSVNELSMGLSFMELAGLLEEGNYLCVADGMYYLTRILVPDLSPEKFRSGWQSAGDGLACEITDGMTAVEKTEMLNFVFYDRCGFRMRTDMVGDRKGTLLSCIMENREGGPVGLSSLYVLLACHAGLQIYPLFPKSPGFFISYFDNGNALFTIDMGNRGRISEPVPRHVWRETDIMGTDRSALYLYAAALRRFCPPSPSMSGRILDRILGMLKP